MKTTLDGKLSGIKQTTIWMNELPDLTYSPIQESTKSVSASGMASDSEPRSCGVELYIPTGAQRQFGILGATFTPVNGTTSVSIRAAVSACDTTNGNRQVEWSYASKTDIVYAGLPEVYAEAAIEGAAASLQAGLLGGGVLEINRAAFGRNSSSQAIFRSLGALLVRLVSFAQHEPDDDALAELINKWREYAARSEISS